MPSSPRHRSEWVALIRYVIDDDARVRRARTLVSPVTQWLALVGLIVIGVISLISAVPAWTVVVSGVLALLGGPPLLIRRLRRLTTPKD